MSKSDSKLPSPAALKVDPPKILSLGKSMKNLSLSCTGEIAFVTDATGRIQVFDLSAGIKVSDLYSGCYIMRSLAVSCDGQTSLIVADSHAGIVKWDLGMDSNEFDSHMKVIFSDKKARSHSVRDLQSYYSLICCGNNRNILYGSFDDSRGGYCVEIRDINSIHEPSDLSAEVSSIFCPMSDTVGVLTATEAHEGGTRIVGFEGEERLIVKNKRHQWNFSSLQQALD